MNAKLTQYIVANSVEEAASILSTQGRKARVVGGGITLNELAFKGLLGNVTTLIDISKTGLDYTQETEEFLRIGAATTFTKLRAMGAFEDPCYGAIRDALYSIRPVQVRNLATVGGSVCTGLPTLDFPVSAMSLDAQVKIISAKRERTIPLSEFFLDYFVTDMNDNELVAEVQIPKPKPGTVGSFMKFETTSIDLAIINVGTTLVMRRDGTAEDLRIFLGGVGKTPFRATALEQRLRGKVLTEKIIRDACMELPSELNPPGDFRASSKLRKYLSEVFAIRALLRALEKRADRS